MPSDRKVFSFQHSVFSAPISHFTLSPNRFYNEFDLALWRPKPARADEYRTPSQIHRDRILHTSAFRRLQGKTQVFLTGEYDFYRTRLTHSLEVSQIGRSLCAWLRWRSPHLAEDFFIDPDLVEAACLAHDLGHPPFGHAGERSLHRLMAAHGGFEGNAQTLRLLTETIFGHGTRGLNPSRALLDAVLKYKTLRVETPDAAHHYLYDEQTRYLDFVHDGQPFPDTAPPGSARDALRAIECQIMDWADDTAYSLNDIADGIMAGFITIDRLQRWQDQQPALSDLEKDYLRQLETSIRGGTVEPDLNRKIGDFIAACTLEPRQNFLSDRSTRHAFDLVIAPERRTESRLYKKLALELVFRAPSLQQLDFKADDVLQRLFDALADNYLAAARPLHLLPAEMEAGLLTAPDESARYRRLCDFLSSLTDASATRLYRRLFDPHFGGLVDLM